MAGFKVALFGRFQMQCGDRRIEGIEALKVKELLSYLLIHRERMQLRESLAEVLWDNQPPAVSKKYLRQAIWKLKSALDRESCEGVNHDLSIESEWIQLDPSSANWQVDVVEFERIANELKNKRARELDPAGYARLQQAADLYQGELLEGWYQEWCLIERERLQTMYLFLLNKLVQYCEVHQLYEAGLAYAGIILCYDRANERAHRQVMRLHCMAGDRTRALRQYQRCVEALHVELGVEPSERTVQLYELIRTDQHRQPARPGNVAPALATVARKTEPLDQVVEM